HETTCRRVSLLCSQLAGDEPDGHDAVLLRRVQQPFAGALPGRIVVEGDLVEPGECIPHVRLVVHRQPPPAARVNVGEGPVGKPGSLLGLETGHACTITELTGAGLASRTPCRPSPAPSPLLPGAPRWPPDPPAARDAPAEPGRPSKSPPCAS